MERNLPATATIESAARAPWDAAVIGAGPAGALAARQLALGGARTLLVERKAFPRAKVCGGCPSAQALSVLREVGLGELISQFGGRALDVLHLQSGGRAVRLPLPGGIAVSRERFDAIVARAALDAGAAFLPQTTARLLAASNSAPVRSLELTDAAGATAAVQARVVLIAGGVGCSNIRRGEFDSRVRPGSRIGIGTIVRRFPDAYRTGAIFMAVGQHGYLGAVRVEGHALNLAAAVDADFLRQMGNPAAAATAILESAGLPPVPALATADWQGTVPLTRRTQPLAGHRTFVLGDAAGYVEPFTGEGIAWALAAGAAVAPLALAGAAAWDVRLAAEWHRTYRRLVTRRQHWCRLLAAGLRSSLVQRSLLRILSFSPDLARPLVNRISGSRLRLPTSS